MTIDRWIVMAVDYDVNGNCNLKPRVLGTFVNEETAREYVRNDIEEYVDNHTSETGSDLIVDFEKMNCHNDNYTAGCEWNVEKIQVVPELQYPI